MIDLDTFLQGLALTLTGMTLVFMALGLIVLSIYLMGRYLRPSPAAGDRPGAASSLTEERARVAAMAAAIVLATEQAESQLSGAWSAADWGEAPGAWQITHRIRSLTHRL
jgi:Na+-transporting methylmalonyl-CoA/oxaloacetate decarboxylase gamma subunit